MNGLIHLFHKELLRMRWARDWKYSDEQIRQSPCSHGSYIQRGKQLTDKYSRHIWLISGLWRKWNWMIWSRVRDRKQEPVEKGWPNKTSPRNEQKTETRIRRRSQTLLTWANSIPGRANWRARGEWHWWVGGDEVGRQAEPHEDSWSKSRKGRGGM